MTAQLSDRIKIPAAFWAGLQALGLSAAVLVRQARLPLAFPFEVRTVAADDIWLSPFHAGPCLSISVHQYAGMPWQKAFAALETILRDAGGRPHWAKRHTLDSTAAHALYPRLSDFLTLRRDVDPEGKFVNRFFDQLFAIGG